MGRMRIRHAIGILGALSAGSRSCINVSQSSHVRNAACQVAKLSTRATFSPTSESTVLVRDFIQSALYNEETGYFTTRSDAVGELKSPINFSEFEGQRDYMQYVSNLYKESGSSWFTPVELFQPYYGRAIAEYILRSHDMASPLCIYEIGGGSGTCAQSILHHLKMRAPRVVYDTMTYTSVEISPALAKKHHEKVGQGDDGSKQFRVECRDASDIKGWGSVDLGVCFVIMLEVLDNLPHDLIVRHMPKSPWMEMHVSEMDVGGNRSIPYEVSKPLQDDLIARCLGAMNHRGIPTTSMVGFIKDKLHKMMNISELAWVPTGCLGTRSVSFSSTIYDFITLLFVKKRLLEALHSKRPNMVLITSDFSTLPDVRIAGERAPVVASKVGGKTQDYATYLAAKGQADIFFPTDFSILRQLDLSCAAARGINKTRHTTILTSAEFMDIFAETDRTITRDGYNPLLEDFKNTKFYLSTPQRQS